MKGFLLVSLLCSAAFLGASAQLSGWDLESDDLVRRWTSEALIGLINGLQPLFAEIPADGARFPVLPIIINFTDPLYLNETAITLPNNRFLSGYLIQSDTIITGLSTIVDDFSPTIVPLGGTYKLSLPNISAIGSYDADLSLLNGVTTFAGNGSFSFDLKDGRLDFVIGIRLDNELGFEITDLDLDLGFGSFYIEAENGLFNGVDPIWSELNSELALIIEIYWQVARAKIFENLRLIINDVFKDCTLSELASGNFSCLVRDEASATKPVTVTVTDIVTATDPSNTNSSSTEAVTDPSNTDSSPTEAVTDPSTGPATDFEPTSTAEPDDSTSSGSVISMSLVLFLWTFVNSGLLA